MRGKKKSRGESKRGGANVGKNDTIYIIGGLAAGYFLMPQKLKDQVLGGGGSGTSVGFDLGGIGLGSDTPQSGLVDSFLSFLEGFSIPTNFGGADQGVAGMFDALGLKFEELAAMANFKWPELAFAENESPSKSESKGPTGMKSEFPSWTEMLKTSKVDKSQYGPWASGYRMPESGKQAIAQSLMLRESADSDPLFKERSLQYRVNEVLLDKAKNPIKALIPDTTLEVVGDGIKWLADWLNPFSDWENPLKVKAPDLPDFNLPGFDGESPLDLPDFDIEKRINDILQQFSSKADANVERAGAGSDVSGRASGKRVLNYDNVPGAFRNIAPRGGSKATAKSTRTKSPRTTPTEQTVSDLALFLTL